MEDDAHIDPLIKSLMAERKAQGISRVELARILGVSPASIGMWERGDRDTPLSKLRTWMDALKVTVALVPKEPVLWQSEES